MTFPRSKPIRSRRRCAIRLVSSDAWVLAAGGLVLSACIPAWTQSPTSPGPAAGGPGGRVWVVDQDHPQSADENPGTEAAPLRTIGRSVSLVQPGDTIVVKSGVYREEVALERSGRPGQRITLQAAPGHRVVISGADEIRGWRPCVAEDAKGNRHFGEIYRVDLDWVPVQLFQAGRTDGFRIARWPKGEDSEPHRDSIPVEAGDARILRDRVNLTQPAGFWEGAMLGVWHEANDSVDEGRIVAYDAALHELRVGTDRPRPLVTGKDRYFIRNHVNLITGPGEYALDTRRKPFRLYLWPQHSGNPDQQSIEGIRRKTGLAGRGVSHATFAGFEVARTHGLGIGFLNGFDNEIKECAAYQCVHAPRTAAAFGISLGSQTGTTIRHCISVLNSYGINITRGTNCIIEENVSGAQRTDALIVCWYSRGVRLARNYIFDNWDAGHPDGFQTYRDVQGLVLDSNLFLSVGQGWQCAETQDALVTNNIWAGIHWPNSVSCSLRKAVVGDQNLRNTFINNTFLGGAVSSGGESRFLNNIAIPPSFGGCADGPTVESDYNLVWSDTPYVFKWGAGGNRRPSRGPFAAWQRATGGNPHSLFAQPRFRSGPAFERRLGALPEGGPGPWKKLSFHRIDSTGFKKGDLVEIDCDGVPREVERVGRDFIEVTPPLLKAPQGNLSFLWNWQQNRTLLLDLRLADGSPGRGAGRAGADIGSSIDIPAYMRRDFDGDGTRDTPHWPHLLDLRTSLARWLR